MSMQKSAFKSKNSPVTDFRDFYYGNLFQHVDINFQLSCGEAKNYKNCSFFDIFLNVP